MSASPTVSLEVASLDSAELLSNLLGLYVHDMSEFYPVEIGVDGRFRYEKLPLYWSERDTHFPYLVHFGGHLAGFALATRGSPASADPEDLDVAEFFVLRRYRRSGIGRQAAFLLWNGLPGHWVVRVSSGNRQGLAFWRATVDEYTRGAFAESTRSGSLHDLRVFTFTAAQRQ
jgi:predicted acetyltransferase